VRDEKSGARLEAGLFTAAMDETVDRTGQPAYFIDPALIGGDVDITRAQNRNFLIGEGFRRMVEKSDAWTVLLRYKVLAEREYRRAIEDFERLKKLRKEMPNHPGTGAETREDEEDIAPLDELNPTVAWDLVEPAGGTGFQPVQTQTKPRAAQPRNAPVNPTPFPLESAP
jgi:hypothetical protein